MNKKHLDHQGRRGYTPPYILLRVMSIRKMSYKIKEFDVVALLRDIPEAKLVQGQVGTVAETLGDSAYEVEFCGDDGRAYAMLGIQEKDLMVLHYSRVEAA